MPPTGSHGLQVNQSSPPPPVYMTPPGAPFDDDNPLQFPPWDNSTGTLQYYVPGNLDANVTRKGEAPDCVFARDHGAGAYHQTCQTYPHKGSSMQVRITVSGTGYVHQISRALLLAKIANKGTAKTTGAGARASSTTCTGA